MFPKPALDVCQVIILEHPSFDSSYDSNYLKAEALINFEFDGCHFGVAGTVADLGLPPKKYRGLKKMKTFFSAHIGTPMEITKVKKGTGRETHLRLIGLDRVLEKKDQRIVTPSYESALKRIVAIIDDCNT